MAVPTNFPRGLTGDSGVKQGLYEVSTVEQGAIGSVLQNTYDGSEYVYSYFAGACGPGKIAAMDASAGIQTSFDAAFVDSGGSAKDTYAAGDNFIYVKNSTITSDDVKNVWAGGYLMITDAGGEGHKYFILGHEAGGDTQTNTIGLNIEPGLVIALESEGSCSIIGHPYNNLAIANNETDDVVKGITLVDVAAGEYAWVQRRGHGVVLADETAGTIAAGTVAVLSDGVNGAAEPLNIAALASNAAFALLNFAEPYIGTFLTVAVDTEYVAIDIQIGG